VQKQTKDTEGNIARHLDLEASQLQRFLVLPGLSVSAITVALPKINPQIFAWNV